MGSKHLSIGAGIAVFLISLTNASANYDADVKAISSLQGCYEVEFKFEETKQLVQDSAYKPSPRYHEKAIELAVLDESSKDGLQIQHILMPPGGHSGPIKHWRQEWTYEPLNVVEFHSGHLWQKIPHAQTEGKWAQWVRSVDDSPRYAGISAWVHQDLGNEKTLSYWGALKSEYARSPLPRREMARKDYQLLLRSHTLTAYGESWILSQDNTKVRLNADLSELPLATEEGSETHRKVDPAQCAEALKWWTDSKPVWDEIRAAWDERVRQLDVIHLKGAVDGKPLFMRLNDLADQAKKSAMPAQEVRTQASKILKLYLI